ncbi:hypothetical protein OS493_039140 [Desmophyllum pertusum]|uniref:Uncharacterized protein n=1 Tax=Desmophyllum pertusum TaxID=174260 RepID=A0A9W9ZHC1_9CNID|nr:hypothetical protein OS493_039140 [Desmophyllum pertusum]
MSEDLIKNHGYGIPPIHLWLLAAWSYWSPGVSLAVAEEELSQRSRDATGPGQQTEEEIAGSGHGCQL